MNNVTLIGRLTKDPDVKGTETKVARYTLAVDRRYKKEGAPTADFISCVAFGRNAEFAEKYLNQGIKIGVQGHIQTGSYTKNDGTKVYTTDVCVDNQEFVESKRTEEAPRQEPPAGPAPDQFMDIPDTELDNLPFH